MASANPSVAHPAWPPPAFESLSPYTATPSKTLEKSVTELLEAMAGANTPVFREDCCKTNPMRAEAIRT
jgi:hypothetical protein